MSELLTRPDRAHDGTCQRGSERTRFENLLLVSLRPPCSPRCQMPGILSVGPRPYWGQDPREDDKAGDCEAEAVRVEHEPGL